MVSTLFKYFVSFALIFSCCFLGTTIQNALKLPIPGSIIGMLMLFSLMASGLIKSEWVKLGASIFIRYMVLLFVPISVGLMDHFDLLLSNATSILASAVGGTTIVLVSLGLMIDRILKRGHK
jgi:holin-like protein